MSAALANAIGQEEQTNSYQLHVCSECLRSVETFGNRHDFHLWDSDSEMCASCAEKESRAWQKHYASL